MTDRECEIFWGLNRGLSLYGSHFNRSYSNHYGGNSSPVSALELPSLISLEKTPMDDENSPENQDDLHVSGTSPSVGNP